MPHPGTDILETHRFCQWKIKYFVFGYKLEFGLKKSNLVEKIEFDDQNRICWKQI